MDILDPEMNLDPDEEMEEHLEEEEEDEDKKEDRPDTAKSGTDKSQE